MVADSPCPTTVLGDVRSVMAMSVIAYWMAISWVLAVNSKYMK